MNLERFWQHHTNFSLPYIEAPMALTKKAIATAVNQGTGMPFGQAYQLVETALGIIKTTLAGGEEVLISGFGKFKVNQKAARRGRNPATGEDMMLKPRKVVTFSCSGKLKKRLNEEIG
jgi:integration host factor subunit alpha